MQLHHLLQTTTKGSSTNMDYVDKKRTISHSLALVARPITDEDLMSDILFGLDSSYVPFALPLTLTLITSSLTHFLVYVSKKRRNWLRKLNSSNFKPLPYIVNTPTTTQSLDILINKVSPPLKNHPFA